jgi:hypothetical protein
MIKMDWIFMADPFISEKIIIDIVIDLLELCVSIPQTS